MLSVTKTEGVIHVFEASSGEEIMDIPRYILAVQVSQVLFYFIFTCGLTILSISLHLVYPLKRTLTTDRHGTIRVFLSKRPNSYLN
jgi:hypothetical protein